MAEPALKDCLDAVACPSCGTRVILTKERILFCQQCCVGYPVQGEVPDFRSPSTLNFKKMVVETQQGVTAQFIVPQGKAIRDSVELKKDHCLVFGRATRMDGDSDITYVGLNETVINLNTHTLQLIEKFLSQSRPVKSGGPKALAGLPLNQVQSLGGFIRNTDIFLDDRSISRAHAVFYHDGEDVWVLDLVSKNGTYVNGREVERAKLKHNDVVSLGTVGVKVKLR